MMAFRTLIFLLLIVAIAACDPGVPEIHVGSDVCAHCMMTISDARFAAATRSSTGKVYRFDSIECMTSYEIANLEENEVQTRWVSDYYEQQLMELSGDVVVVKDPAIHSPMAASLAAFENRESSPAGAPGFSYDELKEYVGSLNMTRGISGK